LGDIAQNVRRRPLCLRSQPFKMSVFYIQSNSASENVVELAKSTSRLAARPKRSSLRKSACGIPATAEPQTPVGGT
jgi:hypothetical protein